MFYTIGLPSNFTGSLIGAANFRKTEQKIYGVAQPTISGIRNTLKALKCGPEENERCLWITLREEPVIYIDDLPYVLRQKLFPFRNIKFNSGMSSERIEQMEIRLKNDIIKESQSNGGLILVHDEFEDRKITPALTAFRTIRTTREVFDYLISEGYKVSFQRVPISPEQAPSDDFIDKFLLVLQSANFNDHILFNCGMGVGRTTFAMVSALIFRQSVATPKVQHSKRVDSDKNLLKLIYVMEKGLLHSIEPRSAIEWALDGGGLMENFSLAFQGKYRIVNELVRLLENGENAKMTVDMCIDRCDSLINLREKILLHRIEHSVRDDTTSSLKIAMGYLERYMSLIVLSSFLESGSEQNFESWLLERPEISRIFRYLKKKGTELSIFRPVDDLEAFKMRATMGHPSVEKFSKNLDADVVKARSGKILISNTILKVDLWNHSKLSLSLPNAANFRPMKYSCFPSHSVFGVAQTSVPGIFEVISQVKSAQVRSVVWINLREEPVVYIDEMPYVLRDEHLGLRNTKSFTGIRTARLEAMETQLVEDILSEAENYDGKILVHDETEDGNLFPIWEEKDYKISTMRQIFNSIPNVDFFRIPITAGDAPEIEDFDVLVGIVSQYNIHSVSVVLNCQLGTGRSTIGMIIVSQIMGWLKGEFDDLQKSELSSIEYPVIRSLVRVLQHGLNCKHIVDCLIADSAFPHSIKDKIIHWKSYMKSANRKEKALASKKALMYLKRYVLLIAFQGYLTQTDCHQEVLKLESFGSWIKRHKEIEKLIDELDETDLQEISSMDFSEKDFNEEVLHVISGRSGVILGQFTILKYDHFPGCQKLSLDERIHGAPNFRSVALSNSLNVYGLAMPTKNAIYSVLEKIEVGKDGSSNCFWFCLREEPVLFVKGKPYVLRVYDEPVVNIETTGIVRERVELMENNMKLDVLKELKKFGNRILLHEEEVIGNSFRVIPIWVNVRQSDIQTPKEVFDEIIQTGTLVTYVRIPITDEQAPIPLVFDELEKTIRNIENPCKLMFNCQMGRGRTTTGMVIANLLLKKGVDERRQAISGAKNRFLDGEYKLIMHLIQILPLGRKAKEAVDLAIDSCDHIQNLREAIYDYKLKYEKLCNQKLHEIGLNYLIRYFYLIAFANWVLECEKTSFSIWLSERPEIDRLIEDRNVLDFQ